MPADAAWSRFNREKFVLAVQKCLDVYPRVLVPYVDATAKGPAPDQAATGELPRDVQNAICEIRDAVILLNVFCFKDDDRAALSPFFDTAELPRAPCHKAHFEVVLALFRSHYHWLHHVLTTVTCADRRAAWKYEPPEIHGDGDKENVVEPHENWRPYTSAFHDVLAECCNVLFFLTMPYAVRSRVAGDVVAVEAIHPSPSYAYEHQYELVQLVFRSFETGLLPLAMLVLNNRMPFVGTEDEGGTLNLFDRTAITANPVLRPTNSRFR